MVHKDKVQQRGIFSVKLVFTKTQVTISYPVLVSRTRYASILVWHLAMQNAEDTVNKIESLVISSI